MIYHKKSSLYYFLYFVYLLLMFYALEDFLTSKNTTGLKNLDRRGVYLALVFIQMVLGVYYAYAIVGVKVIRSSRRFGGLETRPSVMVALWLLTGWMVFVNLLTGTGEWVMLIHLGLSVLWILAFYFFNHYLRRFPKAWPQMKVCNIVMFVFYVFSALYGLYTIKTTYDRIAVVNLAYGVIVFLPWISLLEERRLRLFGFAIVLLVVAISMKRGAIIVFPLMLTAMLIVDAILRKRKIRSILKIIFSIVLFFVVMIFMDQWVGGYLSDRFTYNELSSGSGRVALYEISLEEILRRDLWDLLLGEGSGSVIELLGTAAHNEWLEFLLNYGVVGAIFYGWLCVVLALKVVALIRTSSRYASTYAMAVVYMLVVGMFGQIYFAHSTFYIMALFGALEGLLFNDTRSARRLVSESI